MCDGDGHTEALRVEYDGNLTSYEELLDFFWQNYHGTSHFQQYKAAIWVHDQEQRAAVLRSLEATLVLGHGSKLPRDSGPRDRVEILNAGVWYDAEEYHQKYLEKSSQKRMPPSFPSDRGSLIRRPK